MTARDIQKILAEVVSPTRLVAAESEERQRPGVRGRGGQGVGWRQSGSGTLYVAPGSPWQNGFAESFHSRLRDEFLEREEFENESPGASVERSVEGGL